MEIHTKGELPDFLKRIQEHNDRYNTRIKQSFRSKIINKLIRFLTRWA